MTLLERNSRPVRARSILVLAHSHPCTHILTLTHSTYTNSPTHTHSPSYTHTQSPSHSHTLSNTHTHTLSLSHTHTHTLSLSHTHTHTRLPNSINSAGSSVSADPVSLTIAPAKHKAFSCFNGDRQSVCFCNYRLSFCQDSPFWEQPEPPELGKAKQVKVPQTRGQRGWGREASRSTSGNC